MWLAVIFDAILKLDSTKEFFLTDENDNYILRDGSPIRQTEGEEAQEFLSGRSGALWPICKLLDLNANIIIQDYKKLGPAKIKEKMLAYLRGI